MEDNNIDKQDNIIKIHNNSSESEGLDRCVLHLHNLKHNLKDKDFAMQWIKDLLSWQLAKNNMDEVSLCLSSEEIKPSYLNNVIRLSTKGLKELNLRTFAQLTDTIIHEFNHHVTDLNNQKIKKDEFGNKASKYLKSFPYWYMYHFLDKHFEDKILLGDIINGLYYKCEYEEIARNVAFDENINLVKSAINSASFIQKIYLKKLLKMISKNERDNYYSFAEDVSQHNNFSDILQNISEDFQRNLTIKSDDDYTSLYVARYLYVSDELDQVNFKKLVDQNQVNSAFSLVDEIDFINNIDNILQLDKLLKHNNMDIKNAQFKTLDRDRVLEVVNQYNMQKAQNVDSISKQEIHNNIKDNHINDDREDKDYTTLEQKR